MERAGDPEDGKAGRGRQLQPSLCPPTLCSKPPGPGTVLSPGWTYAFRLPTPWNTQEALSWSLIRVPVDCAHPARDVPTKTAEPSEPTTETELSSLLESEHWAADSIEATKLNIKARLSQTRTGAATLQPTLPLPHALSGFHWKCNSEGKAESSGYSGIWVWAFLQFLLSLWPFLLSSLLPTITLPLAADGPPGAWSPLSVQESGPSSRQTMKSHSLRSRPFTPKVVKATCSGKDGHPKLPLLLNTGEERFCDLYKRGQHFQGASKQLQNST